MTIIFERSEGRVYGARYLTVQPELGNSWIYSSSNNWKEMTEWMIETFGPTPKDGVWTPNARWYVNNSKFWFRNEEDLNWFVLRWS